MAKLNLLEPGTEAPYFEALDQHEKLVKLTDFRGKKLVLYFYPKDMTPGCTVEAKNLRDNYEILKKEGLEVVGVSTDDVESHKKFAAKHNLPFSLLADPEKKIVKAYGVWGKKKMFGKEYEGTHRITYIIDEEGKILDVIKKVKTKEHAQQILERLQKLNK